MQRRWLCGFGSASELSSKDPILAPPPTPIAGACSGPCPSSQSGHPLRWIWGSGQLHATGWLFGGIFVSRTLSPHAEILRVLVQRSPQGQVLGTEDAKAGAWDPTLHMSTTLTSPSTASSPKSLYQIRDCYSLRPVLSRDDLNSALPLPAPAQGNKQTWNS
jgi:hypothetical protein